jgi:hypothetical protein
MKRAFISIALAVLAMGWHAAHAEEAKVYYGEVSDSQCALNVHSLTRSHAEMLKSKHMGGTPAECALYCIQHLGGNLVLSSKKDVYHLDNQELALKFVGKKVKLSGVLDSKNDTIHVVKIEPQP